MTLDLTNNNFEFTENIVQNGIGDVAADIATYNGITSCFCSSTIFDCLTGEILTIKQNEKVFVCLDPNSADVTITNFEMKLAANDSTYKPIEFGSSGWNKNPLMKVVQDDGSNKIRVEVFTIGGLFSSVKTEMKIIGNVFLTFKTGGKMLQLAPYELTAQVEAVTDEDCTGGFGLFSKLFGI